MTGGQTGFGNDQIKSLILVYLRLSVSASNSLTSYLTEDIVISTVTVSQSLDSKPEGYL